MDERKMKNRSMFNEALKQQYVKYAISISESQNINLYKRSIENRFIRSRELEKQIGKDICKMNQDEIGKFLKEFLCGGTMYQSNTISTLKSYVAWAIANQHTFIAENPFDMIKVNDIDITKSYANTMIKDENDLVESLDTILDDVERETADNAKWCIFLLIFAGISFKDIFYIKKGDVSLENRIIYCGSKAVHISDILYDVLSYYLNMDELQKSGKSDAEYGKVIIDEGYLISNTRQYGVNRDKMRLSYTSDVSFIMKSCAKNLKPSSIYDSGVFCRMNIKEQKTGEVDCIEYLEARKHRDVVISHPDKVKKICQHEYETWKRAFDL